MKIEHGEKFKNSFKKLKNKHFELDVYDKVLNHMQRCIDFSEFSKSPISYIYGYEALKYELNGYHSCNLNKNGGTVRLIFTTDGNELITLEYVSTDHYIDFKKVI